MKKILFLTAICILVFPIHAMCSPFLTCDCTPVADAVTGFGIQIGTATPLDIPAVATCGTGTTQVTCTSPAKTLCYDLASLPSGAYSIKALAKNAWGSSPYTLPLTGAKTLPSSPSSFRIIP